MLRTGRPFIKRACFAVLAVPCLGWGGAHAGLERAFPNRVYVTGADPLAVAVADLNRDGSRDLVVVNAGSDDVSVLLGKGGGEFGPERRFEVGGLPNSVAVADLNGDSVVDMAIANYGTNDVSIRIGRGDGSFLPQARYRTGDAPGSIVVGDFNGDQNPDLLTANSRSSDVSFLAGAGDGAFMPPVFSAAGVWPTSVATGDFNGDGILDLAVADADSSEWAGDVHVLLGRGDGSFNSPQSFRAGFTPSAVAAEDLNEDGHLDLAVANYSSHDVSVLLGMGDGTFQTQLRSAGGHFPVDIKITDLDRDGHKDVLLGDLSLDGVPFLRGRGNGTFDPQVAIQAGLMPVGVTSDDLNSDGNPDLVVANVDSDDVSVLLGLGGGRFPAAPRYEAGVGPWDMAAGDFNNDGGPDVAVANFWAFAGPTHDKSFVSILLGVGNGAFHPQRLFESVRNPQSVAVADFDGDGRPDLAFGGGYGVGVSRGLGGGSFDTPQLLPGVWSPAIASADFNRDGFPDLALAVKVADLRDPYETQIWLGSGSSGFNLAGSFQVGLTPHKITPGDLNGDSILDLVVINETYWITVSEEGPSATGDVSVLLGVGDGSFEPEQRYAAGRRPSDAAIADFNRDGMQDLAVVNAGRDVWVRLGQGNGELGPEARYSVGRFPRAIVAGDFDADGAIDLAVSNSGNNVSLLAGLGDGRFAPEVRFAAGIIPTSLVAADFNRDGFLDLATANFGSEDVTVLLNQTPLNRRPPFAVIRTLSNWECTSAEGATVMLDGSASSDPDSPPGGTAGIVAFEWYKDYGTPAQALLGMAPVLEVVLPLGSHEITLRVRDDDGEADAETVQVAVGDSTPPTLEVSLTPAVLWPPKGQMIEIQARTSVSDACGEALAVLERVWSSDGSDAQAPDRSAQGPDIQGAEIGTGDFQFFLRAERPGNAGPRSYWVRYRAVDSSGNSTEDQATVVVPHDLRQNP